MVCELLAFPLCFSAYFHRVSLRLLSCPQWTEVSILSLVTSSQVCAYFYLPGRREGEMSSFPWPALTTGSGLQGGRCPGMGSGPRWTLVLMV